MPQDPVLSQFFSRTNLAVMHRHIFSLTFITDLSRLKLIFDFFYSYI